MAVTSTPTSASSSRSITHNPFAKGVTRRSLLGGGLGLGLAASSLTLSGCSTGSTSKGGAGASDDGYKPGSASLRVKLGEEIKGPVYPEPWRGPIARKINKFGDDATEFTILTRYQTGSNLTTNAYSKWLQTQTGVKVKYQTVPMGDEGAPKVNAIIAGGDLPDAFMLGPEWMGGFTRSQIYVYGQQGLFQPLDKLVDEYAPELQQMFKWYPGLRKYLTAPNGTMYAFPAVNDCYHCKSQFTRAWINSDWLNKVGMEIPKTLDQLRKVLEAFKKQNPSGLADSIPFSGCKTDWWVGYFMQSFLDSPKPSHWLVRNGGNLVFTPTEDGFREGLKFMAGLVADGLYDRAAFTQTSDQLQRRVMNKKGPSVGAAYGNTPGVFATLDYGNPKAVFRRYHYLPPVTGPDGRAHCPWDYTPPGLTGLVISKSCKKPETLVQWADTQLGLIPSVFQHAGPLGKGFTWAKKGEKGIDGRQSVYTYQNSSATNTGWGEWGPYGLTLDVRNANTVSGDTIEPTIYAAGKASEPFATPREQFFQTPYYDADQAAQIGELATNLQNFYDQSITRFCLGQDNINDDGAWKSYKNKFDQIGVKQYLEINEQAMKNQ